MHSFFRDWQVPVAQLDDGEKVWAMHWPDLPGDRQVDHHTADTPFWRDWWLVCWPSKTAAGAIHMAIVGRELPQGAFDRIKKKIFRFCLGPTSDHNYNGFEIMVDDLADVLNDLIAVLGRWHHEIVDDDWRRISDVVAERRTHCRWAI